MTAQPKWLSLWVGFLVAAVVAALALGVSPGILLILALLLGCPLAMYFGMRGMGSQPTSGHAQRGEQPGSVEAQNEAEEREHQAAHTR